MKKINLKVLIIIFLLLFSTGGVFSQEFEGIIEFRKISSIDTASFIYYIKDDKVRIDEIGYDKKTEGIMIFDLNNFKAQSLSPARLLFVEMDSPATKEFVKIKDVHVSKGKKTRKIAGYQCQEWVVTKKDQNIQVTYYLAVDNFEFFERMLITMNRKDKLSVFYQQLPQTKNAFPFYAVESDINGNHKNTLEVISVTKKTLEKSLFKIPEGYKRFEK